MCVYVYAWVCVQLELCICACVYGRVSIFLLLTATLKLCESNKNAFDVKMCFPQV